MIRILRTILPALVLLLPALAAAQKDKVVFATQNVNYKEGMEEVARRYMVLHPDVEVEMIFITLNYETWVRTQFAGGEKLAPIMGLDCWWAGAGVRLRFVKRRGVLNVLRAEVSEGSDLVEFEPVKSIELPAGTAVKTDYDDAEPPTDSGDGPPGASEPNSG